MSKLDSRLEQSKSLIQKALASLPENNGLADVRAGLRRTLMEFEVYEKKNHKRSINQDLKETPAQKWQYDLQKGVLVSPFKSLNVNPHDILKKLDDLIAIEEAKLNGNKDSNDEVGTILD